MARNKVQFQKGLSEAQFAVLYGTEDQCREAVMRSEFGRSTEAVICLGAASNSSACSREQRFLLAACATIRLHHWGGRHGGQRGICRAGQHGPADGAQPR